MRTLFTTPAILLAFLITASPAFAQPNRYTMTPSSDGFLRLDTLTGAVSICNKKSGEWQCESLAPGSNESNSISSQPNNITQAKIDKLLRENKELKAEIKKLEEEIFKISRNGDLDKKTLKLPSEEDVDKVMSFMERMIERLKGLGKKLQEDDKKNFGTPL